jgi:hypothetical protein
MPHISEVANQLPRFGQIPEHQERAVRRAQLTAARHAQSPEELTRFLDILGLLRDTR